MRRTDVVADMAQAIWHSAAASDWHGRRIPQAAYQAAKDLAKLYEDANRAALMDLAHHLPLGDEDSPGMMLVIYALGAQDAPAGIRVPSFLVTLAGDELTWEGDSRQTNPWPTSSVQSLLFDRHRFTPAQAKAWAQSHGYRHGAIDSTANYHHIRQYETVPRIPCRTVAFTRDGTVKAVVCATGKPNPCGCEHGAAPLANPARQLSASEARALIKIRSEAHDIMSDAAADRMVNRINKALTTGVLDQDLQETLATWGDDDPDQWDDPMAVFRAAARGNPAPPDEVLLIEDEPGLQRATTRMIKRIYPDANVLVADSYDTAIGVLEAHPRLSLVISDVNIVGGKSGIDVFEWVKQNRPDLVDRYVFFTGGNPQVESMHYRYLEKPALVPDMKAVIEKPAPMATKAPWEH